MKRIKNISKGKIFPSTGKLYPGDIGEIPDDEAERLLALNRIIVFGDDYVRQTSVRQSAAESGERYSGPNVEKDVQGRGRSNVAQTRTNKPSSNTKQKQAATKRTSPKRPIIRKASSINTD